MEHVIYLHGFLSSPKSAKAQLVKDYILKNHSNIKLHAPTLPGSPLQATKVIEQLIPSIFDSGINRRTHNKDTPINNLRFIGSSMGGFLATCFIEKHGGKAVLINPAVEPFKLLKNYFGEHSNPYTGEVFTIDESNVQQLLNLYKQTKKNDSSYLVYLQKGDETLDYQLAEDKYGSDCCRVEDGGDHSFVGLENHLADIIRFLTA